MNFNLELESFQSVQFVSVDAAGCARFDVLTQPALTGPRYMNETHQRAEKRVCGNMAIAVVQGQRIHINVK
jgi:hypothetical protein